MKSGHIELRADELLLQLIMRRLAGAESATTGGAAKTAAPKSKATSKA